MANDDDSEYGKLVKNFFVSMLILMSMLSVLPAISYGFAVSSKGKTQNSELIENYRISSKDHDKFNTFEEIYLFCTYIPIKRVKICGDEDEYSTFLYNKTLKEASDVIDLLKDLSYKSRIGGEKTKKEATDAIIREKEKREQREHEQMLAYQKDASANSRFDRTHLLKWLTFLSNNLSPALIYMAIMLNTVWGRFVQAIKIFTPIIVALASNRVFVGFVILVIIIAVILGLLKPKDKQKKKKNATASEDDGSDIYSIWDDIMDTYNYYRDMLRNFKLSSMSGGLIPEEEVNAANDENGLIIDRKTIDGKSYDNLSYVMLSDIFNDNEVRTYYGKNANMERGRYYNIYLPDEKFKDNMPSIKWNVSDGAKQNEKVWRIDCEKLDTLNKKSLDDGSAAVPTLPAIPAFIKKGNKCVINANGLDKINKPPLEIEEDIPFKTEYIR